jgi:hypothetical protein
MIVEANIVNMQLGREAGFGHENYARRRLADKQLGREAGFGHVKSRNTTHHVRLLASVM